MMIINGVDLATVSSILDHARVSTTADFYLGAVESVPKRQQ
jgi:site-specific recombinase XerD